jgi:hypothetical protein
MFGSVKSIKKKKNKNNKRKVEKEFFQFSLHIHTEKQLNSKKKSERKRKKVAIIDGVLQIFLSLSNMKISGSMMLQKSKRKRNS